MQRLRHRADFLAAAKGLACARGAVLGAVSRPAGRHADLSGIGFTAPHAGAGAARWVRNRCKRRLREAARAAWRPSLHARPGCDYVFIARGGTAQRPWARLLDDMENRAVKARPADLGAQPRGRASPPKLSFLRGHATSPMLQTENNRNTIASFWCVAGILLILYQVFIIGPSAKKAEHKARTGRG